MYSPTMATIIAKQKRRKLYYYVVESARVEGQPRIVKQTYLGTAERVAALVQDRTAPLPLSVTKVEFGLPGALWLAAQQSDRKSTRLNSSHVAISYAVFCL